MFNLPQNNQQLIPMDIQQQPIANMPIQNAQTYYPSVKNLSYGNDTFVNVGAPQKDIAKGFWDGFKTVFSKIGEFCSDNFALILTGVGLFGGCKFCSSSMKTYEENKKNKNLDAQGNLSNKDASLKDKAMNSFGYYVHKVFGSSNSEEVKEEKTTETEKVSEIPPESIEKFNVDNFLNYDPASKDNAKKTLLNTWIYSIDENIKKTNISDLLTKYSLDEKLKLIVLERIAYNYNKLKPTTRCCIRKDTGQSLIIDTLTRLTSSPNATIKKRALKLITEITNQHDEMKNKQNGIKLYFKDSQIERLKNFQSQSNQQAEKEEDVKNPEDLSENKFEE